jgi:hypothetical protein
LPYYTYLDKKTKEVVETDVGLQTISEMEAFLKKNKHLELGVTGAPGFGDAFRLGIRKPSEHFRDTLRHIKKKHKGSTINIR